MTKRLGLLVTLALLLSLLLPRHVAAQGPTTPEETDPNWSAS